MSINKYFLPDPEEIVKHIEKTGPKLFVWYHRRDEAIIGNTVSLEILEETEKLVKDGLSDEIVMLALREKYPDAFNLA